MAKSESGSFLQRHVEKLVLGVGVLVFLVALLHWGLGSPLSVDMASLSPGSDTVPLDQVDQTLLERAKLIEASHAKYNPPEVERPNVYPQFAADLESFIRLPLPPDLDSPPAAPNYPTKFIQRKGPSLAADILPGMPDCNQPLVWLGTYLVQPPEGQQPRDSHGAHVVTVIDINKTRQAWQAALEPTRIPLRLAVYEVQAEVQVLAPDGAWVPAQGATFYREPVIGSDGQVIDKPVIPDYTQQTQRGVLDAIYTVSDPAWQDQILMPAFPDVFVPPDQWMTWQVNLPQIADVTTVSTVEVMHAEGTMPVMPTPRTRPTTPSRRTPMDMPPDMPPDWGMPPDGGMPGRQPTTRPRTRRPAPTPTPMPMPMPAGQPGTGAPAVETISITEVPDFRTLLESGRLPAWVHVEGLEPGRTYRFRMRASLINPLYGYPEYVLEQATADATEPNRKLLTTDWSPWSAPKEVPNLTRFWLTGGSASNNTMVVDVYRRALSQWVRQSFTVHEGELIGQPREVKVVNPVDPTKVLTLTADFSTGSVAVRFDFNRKVYRPGSSRPSDVPAMLSIAPEGGLEVRVYQQGTTDPELKDLQQEAERTRKKVMALSASAAAAGGTGAATP